MARTDIMVLGAGIVGTSIAVHLAKRGLSVALIDRQGAGEGTSYGNAGIIEGNTIFPPAFPSNFADLGYLMMHWTQQGDEVGQFNLQRVTMEPGFPNREELIARYEERSGRSMRALTWYVTLALWKSVVFMEGNYKRAVSGSTDDPYLKSFGDGVVELAQRALRVTRDGF